MSAYTLPLIVVLTACTRPPAPADPHTDGLLLSRAKLARARAERLAANRFAYFRRVAEAFELRTCAAFADVIGTLPTTAIHGDAHVEQFAVTQASYGLEDFDRGGFGPAVVDLVRYAASLELACNQVSWPCVSDAIVERFLRTYRAKLVDEQRVREPSIVPRLRAKAAGSRHAWLSNLDRRTLPLDPTVEAGVRRRWAVYARRMQEVDANWTAAVTRIVRIGRVEVGVGSADEPKALVRIAGHSSLPDDDVIVELRLGITSQPHSCVWRGEPNGSVVVMVMAMVRRRQPELQDFALGDQPFWIQSWEPTYVEVALADLQSQAELEELADDAAQQLAVQSSVWLPDPMRRQHRHAQAAAFDQTKPRIVALAHTLAMETSSAWNQFRSSVR